MSAKNKLESKRKRRVERTERKNAFRKQLLAQRMNQALPPMELNIPTEADTQAMQELITEARLAEQGFLVARNEDMLWKPGDED